MARLLPYLNFPGTTAEAMGFYHSIFGGEYTRSTFGEYGAVPEDSEDADRIMHAQIVSGEVRIMAADELPGASPRVRDGDNVSMSLVGPEEELLSGWFERLAEGGRIVMPLEVQIWGDRYGSLVDRFGVNWMVNIELPKPAAEA